MKKVLVLAAALALPFAGASAYYDGGLGGVSGSNGYSGLNGFVEFGTGNGFFVRPAFSTYKADGSGGTYATYSARAGYDGSIWSAGGETGITPSVNGYKNVYFAGDFTISLSPTGGKKTRLAGPRVGTLSAKGEGLTRVDLGAGLNYTSHSFDALSDSIGQTDGSLFAGVLIMGTQISSRYTKNLHYSEDITGATPQAMKVDLPGTIICTQGYVNQTWNARLDWAQLPLVSPYISYTFAQYKAGHPSSKSYLLGASIGLNMLSVSAAYQIFDPGEGFSSKSFFSLGAGIKF